MTEGFVPSTVWNLAHTHAAVLLGKVNERSASTLTLPLRLRPVIGDTESGSGSLV